MQVESSPIENMLNVRLDGKDIAAARDREDEESFAHDTSDDHHEPLDMKKWDCPPSGILTFDYVSSKPVPRGAVEQSDEVYHSFKRELGNPALFDDAKLLMIRTAATTHYWKAEQARELVSLVPFPRRDEAAVMLFRRVIDEDNFGPRVFSLLRGSEAKGLLKRLGDVFTPPSDGSCNDKALVFLTEQDDGSLSGSLPRRA